MLKVQALRKIFITTITMFVILSVYTIPTTLNKNENVLRTNLEIEDITNLSTNKIYLLNKDNLLVKVDVFIDTEKQEEQIEKIIDYLTIDNNKIPVGLRGYIPKNTKLLNIKIEENTVFLDFSKEFSSQNNDIVITGIVYSLLELKNIDNIKITVENKPIQNYDKLLNKRIGINNKYLFQSRRNINKVVIYYLDNIKENTYYVPVTEYVNDNREKIEIIIDELSKSSFDDHLISVLNSNTVLLDYKEEENVLFLNFNDYLLEDSTTKDKVLNTIAYSVFDNYDVNMVMFEVNSKKLQYIKRP